MSKSIGNILTVRELLDEGWAGETVRMTLLSTHYRQPLDFTRDALNQAQATLDRIYGALRNAEDVAVGDNDVPAETLAALDDDLNTPSALSHLHEYVTSLNKAELAGDKARSKGWILSAGVLLGIAQQDPESWFKGDGDFDAKEIESLIKKRAQARRDRNFAEADRIRDDLANRGIHLEDGTGGTTWRRAG
jgi:cysteinyl-tRNA synthetase